MTWLGIMLALAVEVEQAPGASPADTLALAREANGRLEYRKVIPIAEAVIAHRASSLPQRIEAYALLGSAYAVAGDLVPAEQAYRSLLRVEPGFDLPASTTPRILTVFRKVKLEEEQIRRQVAALERERLIAEIGVTTDPAEGAVGGVPFDLRFGLRDPRGVVRTATLRYRRGDQAQYSAVAAVRDAAGRFVAKVPGEVLENESGLQVEYFIETADATGAPLKSHGSAAAPLRMEVAPGKLAPPIYRSKWFWTAVGAAVIAFAATGAILYHNATTLPDADLGSHRVPR